MDLAVKKREVLGNKVKKLRREGNIPAELYGHGTDNIHLTLNRSEFHAVYREAGENTIINVDVEGEKRPVIIYDVQFHPITGDYVHVDLYQVNMDEKIETEVPLNFVGVSSAVKSEGGVLAKSLHALPIESLPGNLPHEIEVDISVLDELDKTLYVKDLELPEGVEATIGEETAVVSVMAPTEEEEEEEEEISLEDIEVEGEVERAEREAEKGEGETEEKAAEQGE